MVNDKAKELSEAVKVVSERTHIFELKKTPNLVLSALIQKDDPFDVIGSLSSGARAEGWRALKYASYSLFWGALLVSMSTFFLNKTNSLQCLALPSMCFFAYQTYSFVTEVVDSIVVINGINTVNTILEDRELKNAEIPTPREEIAITDYEIM